MKVLYSNLLNSIMKTVLAALPRMACKFKVAGNPGPESSKRLRRLPVNHFECICPLLNAISHGRSWNNFPEQAAMSVAKRRGRGIPLLSRKLTITDSTMPRC